MQAGNLLKAAHKPVLVSLRALPAALAGMGAVMRREELAWAIGILVLLHAVNRWNVAVFHSFSESLV